MFWSIYDGIKRTSLITSHKNRFNWNFCLEIDKSIPSYSHIVIKSFTVTSTWHHWNRHLRHAIDKRDLHSQNTIQNCQSKLCKESRVNYEVHTHTLTHTFRSDIWPHGYRSVKWHMWCERIIELKCLFAWIKLQSHQKVAYFQMRYAMKLRN